MKGKGHYIWLIMYKGSFLENAYDRIEKEEENDYKLG